MRKRPSMLRRSLAAASRRNACRYTERKQAKKKKRKPVRTLETKVQKQPELHVSANNILDGTHSVTRK